MSVLLLIGMVFVAGGVGGLINGFVNDKGFLLLPKKIERGDGSSFFRPGFLGNILIGAVAATVSWLLYGPLSQVVIGKTIAVPVITFAALGNAVFVGLMGSGWFTNAAGKNLFQLAASQAAAASPSGDTAKQMLMATPGEALKITRGMHPGELASQDVATQSSDAIKQVLAAVPVEVQRE